MHVFRVSPFAVGANKVSGFPRYFLIFNSHVMSEPLHAYWDEIKRAKRATIFNFFFRFFLIFQYLIFLMHN